MKSDAQLTPPRMWRLLARLAAPALIAAPLHAVNPDPNQPPDPTVGLTESSNQGYPGANIYPDICLNAQSEYETTKFDVTITPSDATAELSESGDVSLDKTSVSNGETVTVTGNSTGSYTITITHDDDDTVTDSVGGTVFEFKWEVAVAQRENPSVQNGGVDSTGDSGSSVTANAGTGLIEIENQDGQEVTVFDNGTDGYNNHASVGNEYEVPVIADPSPSSLDVSVKAKAKISPRIDYESDIVKSFREDGSIVALNLDFGILDFPTIGGGGSNEVAGCGFAWQYSIENGSPTNTDIIAFSSDDFSVPFLETEESESNSDSISPSFKDIDRVYDNVGQSSVTKIDVSLLVEGMAKTTKRHLTKRYASNGNVYYSEGASVLSSSNEHQDLTKDDVIEDDGTFEIQ